MSILPDVKLPCDVCKGERFNPETLAVSWRGKSIGDVLKMEVDEAVDFFATMSNIAHPLQLLKDVGLGYLTLGQPSPTLSGGEAQRIKLVTELSKVRDDITKRGNKVPHTLYVLDEPTVGLHMADVERLIRVLHRLVDAGHSVVVIEHDLDVIAEADWVIDLGPEGGVNGGRVVAEAVPEQLVLLAESHTGAALTAVLSRVPAQAQAQAQAAARQNFENDPLRYNGVKHYMWGSNSACTLHVVCRSVAEGGLPWTGKLSRRKRADFRSKFGRERKIDISLACPTCRPYSIHVTSPITAACTTRSGRASTLTTAGVDRRLAFGNVTGRRSWFRRDFPMKRSDSPLVTKSGTTCCTRT